MAKVKITGHASGSGVITVTAPNTSTDRTITLPDSTGTLLDSTSTLDATKLSGNLPAISGAALTGVGVAGITSTANATAITINSDEDVLVNTTASPHGNAGKMIIANETVGGSALGLKGKTTHAAGVGTPIVSLNFIGHNYYGSTNPGIYGQISCQNGNGSYSDRGQLALSTGYAGNQITERLVITSDGRGLSQFTAKVWVKFNGQNTVTINDSHNVSSITDHGTGDHSINFSNNLGNTHYCSVGSTATLSGSGTYFIDTGVGFAVGANRIGTKHTNGDYYDRPYNMVLIFGD
jgi:hypothetical protein